MENEGSKAVTVKFPREFMLDEILYSGERVVSDVIVGHRRWSVDHELIFKHEGRFFRTHYSVGATESQEESPWEYSEGDVECAEVVPVERPVICYEPVEH